MQVALLAHRLEQFAIVALTTMYQRCQNQYLPSGIVVLNHVDDLLLGVFHHRFACLIAVSLAGTGKQQTHIVVNLSGRANGRTRILVGGFLFNADDGRQTCNLVDIWPFHAPQKVARIGRESLDIATLTLGKDGVEGQTRLTGTTQTSQYGQRVAGYFDINILQVVYPCTVDVNLAIAAHGVLVDDDDTIL